MKIKKLLFLSIFLIVALLFIPNTVNADTEITINNIKYQLSEMDNTAIVMGGSGITDVVIPSKVSNNGTSYTVTSIGDYAFFNNQELVSIVIPDSVTSIGDSAFVNCAKLETVSMPDIGITLPNTQNIFSGCSNLIIKAYPGTVLAEYATNQGITVDYLYKIDGTDLDENIKVSNEKLGWEYEATLTPKSGYVLPESIEIKIGDTILEEGVDYYYSYRVDEDPTLIRYIRIFGRSISGDIKINAKAELDTWKIKLILNGNDWFNLENAGLESIKMNGSEIIGDSIEVVKGNECTLEFEFLKNWKLEQINDTIYDNTTAQIYKWTPTTDGELNIKTHKFYTLNFDANGGTGTMASQTFIEGIRQEISSNVFIKDGYIFEGWTVNEDGSGYFFEEGDTITFNEFPPYNQDLTFYARWKKIPTIIDKININFKELSCMDNMTVEEDSVFWFITFYKGLLKFSNENLTVCNQNDKLLFTIEGNTGNIILAEGLTKEDNIEYTLTEDDLMNYDFDLDTIPKTIEIIFAEEIETYKVTLDANGGKFKDNYKYVIDDIINFDYDNFNKPTKEGYKFIGFFTGKTDGKSFDEVMNSEAGIESDITFYAQWEEIKTDEKEDDNKDEENTNTNTGNTDSGNTNTGNTNTNKPTGNNPQTGDNIVMYTVISLIAFAGIAFAIKVKKYVK